MRRLVLLASTLFALSLSGCFNFDEPICSYQCGTGGACPDDYECHNDGYCHRQGSTESCLYSDASVVEDLSVVTQPDLSADLADTDAENADLSGLD